jgi:hypothetical protein
MKTKIHPKTLEVAKRYIKAHKPTKHYARVRLYCVNAQFRKQDGAAEVKEFFDALRKVGTTRDSGRFVKQAILKAIAEAKKAK